MERRSPGTGSPLVYERYKSGCAWSLVRFCDFGHDGKALKSQVLDDLDRGNKNLDLLSNSEGKCHLTDDGVRVNNKSRMIDSAKEDVVRLREREVVIELQVNNTKGLDVPSNSNHKRKASKSFQMHGCKDIATVEHRQPHQGSLPDKLSGKQDEAATPEASCNQENPRRECSCRTVSHQKHNRLSEANLKVKMDEAAEAFINQKFVKGEFLSKKDASHQSKHFLDALEILNSNKELFINLLHDPNSLLAKHIQDLSHSQGNKHDMKSSFSKGKLSECHGTTVSDGNECGCNQDSSDRHPTKKSFDSQNSERIVVLKSGSITMRNSAVNTSDGISPQSLYSLRNRVQRAEPEYFSLGRVKRKLKRAIGLIRKEKKPWISTDCTRHKFPCDSQGLRDGGKGNGRETAQSNSLSKCNHGTGLIEKSSSVRRGDKMGNLKDSGSGTKEQVAVSGGIDPKNSSLSIARHLKQSEFNVYSESRTRLSEVLGNRNEIFSRKHAPINSRRIVSLPEYDFLPALSLGRYRDHGFSATQMRFSPYSYYQMVNEKKQQLLNEKKNRYLNSVKQVIVAPSLADYKRFTDQLKVFDRETNDSPNHFPDITMHKTVSPLGNPSSSRGSVDDIGNFRQISSSGLALESNESHNNGANQTAGPTNHYKDNKHLKCSKLDSSMENFISPFSEDAYLSSPLSMKSLEDYDGLKDKAEHASPVSVLDQLFVEDIPSPLSTKSQSLEPAIGPKEDYYEALYSTTPVTSHEDQKISSSDARNEHESLSRYIKAVLQASSIKWVELPIQCHSSDQLLEPSLLDEVGLLPNQHNIDHKLLFDYINEVLLEMYQCYFSCSPWVSYLKPNAQPVQAGTNVVNEMMKFVDLNILFHRQFQTLEQLVEKDLENSRKTWMDIRIDIEVAITELVESVLEELALEISIDLHI